MRGEQVGTTHVADEQGVAGQHAVRDRVVGVLEDQDADGLGGVARGRHDLQHDLAEHDALAVGQRPAGVLGRGALAVADPRPGRGRELEVPGQEVGVEVGVDHAHDLQAVLGGVRQVLRHVAPRVHDHRLPGGLVPDEVRRLRQAVEVVLLEAHRGVPHVAGMSKTMIPRGVSTVEPAGPTPGTGRASRERPRQARRGRPGGRRTRAARWQRWRTRPCRAPWRPPPAG